VGLAAIVETGIAVGIDVAVSLGVALGLAVAAGALPLALGVAPEPPHAPIRIARNAATPR